MELWQNAINSLPLNTLPCLQPTLQTLYSIWMSHTDTLQGIANTLAYLQYYLHKVSKRQNNSETNINNIFSALTTQLQQLTQLISNSLQSLTPVITLPLSPIVVSPLPATFRSQAWSKLVFSLDFHREQSLGHVVLNSCALYIHLALEQFNCEEKKVLWTLTFFKRDQAVKWSENLFRQEADTGIFPFQTWVNFNQQFQIQFFLVNVEANTISSLEELSYY